MALHGSTSFITRSLTFGWNRSQHGLAAPSTAAILSPFCYRCPVGKSFPSCEVQCLVASMQLADANFTSKPADVRSPARFRYDSDVRYYANGFRILRELQ